MPLMDKDNCDLFQKNLGIIDQGRKANTIERLANVHEAFPVTDKTKDIFTAVTDKLHKESGREVVTGKVLSLIHISEPTRPY